MVKTLFVHVPVNVRPEPLSKILTRVTALSAPKKTIYINVCVADMPPYNKPYSNAPEVAGALNVYDVFESSSIWIIELFALFAIWSDFGILSD